MKTTSEYIAILHKYMAENAHKFGRYKARVGRVAGLQGRYCTLA